MFKEYLLGEQFRKNQRCFGHMCESNHLRSLLTKQASKKGEHMEFLKIKRDAHLHLEGEISCD